MMLKFFLLSILLHSALALNCTQIPESQITNGSRFFLPGARLHPIPANWDCTYQINAPTTLTSGYYAQVTLYNELQGVNDYIEITEITGLRYNVNSRGSKIYNYEIIPGADMYIRVVTKSVLMNSEFTIWVDYHSATIGGTVPMKTEGDMNFLDVSTISSTSSKVATLTNSASEPVRIVYANLYEQLRIYGYDVYFVYGSIAEQSEVYRLADSALAQLTVWTNLTTIVALDAPDVQLVLNLDSEAERFDKLLAHAVNSTSKTYYTDGQYAEAMEFVNYNGVGIIMDDLKLTTTPCKARVVSGPPNSASRTLLDLSTNPPMPQKFDLKYFTVVSDHCDFSFSLKSFQ